MLNKSGLKPVGHAVLLEPYEPEIKKSGIYLPPAVQTSVQIMGNRCIVVEVGSEAWVEERVPRAAVGDKVIVTRYAGYMAVGPADGQQYRIVNDRDIFTVITEEKQSE